MSVTDERRVFFIFADFHQFVVCDRTADWSDLWERWSDEAVSARVVTGPGYVSVGTLRAMPCKVTIGLGRPSHAAPPDLIVETHLSVPSGIVTVSGVTDGGRTGGDVHVPPGHYKLLVEFVNQTLVDDMGIVGGDEYHLTLASDEPVEPLLASGSPGGP